jgi:predicted nucleic acid-binding Zn ribbon protein
MSHRLIHRLVVPAPRQNSTPLIRGMMSTITWRSTHAKKTIQIREIFDSEPFYWRTESRKRGIDCLGVFSVGANKNLQINMARTARSAQLDSRAARLRLKMPDPISPHT